MNLIISCVGRSEEVTFIHTGTTNYVFSRVPFSTRANRKLGEFRQINDVEILTFRKI